MEVEKAPVLVDEVEQRDADHEYYLAIIKALERKLEARLVIIKMLTAKWRSLREKVTG